MLYTRVYMYTHTHVHTYLIARASVASTDTSGALSKWCEGGDFDNKNGTGGESIYGCSPDRSWFGFSTLCLDYLRAMSLPYDCTQGVILMTRASLFGISLHVDHKGLFLFAKLYTYTHPSIHPCMHACMHARVHACTRTPT